MNERFFFINKIGILLYDTDK